MTQKKMFIMDTKSSSTIAAKARIIMPRGIFTIVDENMKKTKKK
jgi:hypothetical protein